MRFRLWFTSTAGTRYTLRSTQAVSRRTVLETQTCSVDKSLFARALCAASSLVRKRTRTLVSAASMAFPNLFLVSLIHLGDRLVLAPALDCPEDFVDFCLRKKLQGFEKNPFVGLFNGQLRPGFPALGFPDRTRDDELAFGRQARCSQRSCSFHRDALE